MARSGRSPWKAGPRDTRYDAIIAEAAKLPMGTVHEIPLDYPDEPTAKAHVNKIYTAARWAGLSRQVLKTQNADGSWKITFRLWSKDEGRLYIVEKAKRSEE